MPKTQTKRGLSPRELDALRKQFIAEQKQADSASKWQLANDIVSGINDIVGRGVIAPILGMPGDINQAIYDAGAWVNNKIKDVEVATGMVKQPRYVQPSQGNAYLGSEDIGNRMQQAGLVSSERRPMTELAASLVSPSAAAKTAINAPKTAMNMLRMADNLEAPSRGVRNAQGMYIPRGQMGAIENLYHGSPHTFDRFDLSKIGTGEGAQAYGHGAYLAESPDVAQSYKATGEAGVLINGKALADRKRFTKLDERSKDEVRDILEMVADGQMSKNELFGHAASMRGDYLTAYNFIRDAKSVNRADGNLYQTRLAWPDAAREAADPLSPENFLEWDKTLAEQSQAVQDKLRPFLSQFDTIYDGKRLTFADESDYLEDIYKRLADGYNNADVASAELAKLGIPGIRYLDAGSRGAGEGTSNYVVFDDKLIDIVSRNNQPIKK